MVTGMADFKRKTLLRSPVLTLGLVSALVSGLGTVSARADEFRARYTVSVIGFHVGEVTAAGAVGR